MKIETHLDVMKRPVPPGHMLTGAISTLRFRTTNDLLLYNVGFRNATLNMEVPLVHPASGDRDMIHRQQMYLLGRHDGLQAQRASRL